jgi:hypothetical protein
MRRTSTRTDKPANTRQSDDCELRYGLSAAELNEMRVEALLSGGLRLRRWKARC